MDAARTALRLGSRDVMIVYRRTKEEMPARVEEVRHATEEGIIFKTLSSPLEFRPGDDGFVHYLICQDMELGEPDESGRRRPIPIEGKQSTVICDTAIVATGTQANASLNLLAPDADKNKRGYIVGDENGRTSIPGVWAGGDISTGSATVILALGAGKKSAADIDSVLKSE